MYASTFASRCKYRYRYNIDMIFIYIYIHSKINIDLPVVPGRADGGSFSGKKPYHPSAVPFGGGVLVWASCASGVGRWWSCDVLRCDTV